jgi:superfamily II DNA or RNA helicase
MRAFETADRTCVVHPTGTGKSYLIAAVSESFKRVLILGPNDFVLDQVHDVLRWRDSAKDSGTVEYMTYQMLCFMDNVPTGYDLICLDEFQHVAYHPN